MITITVDGVSVQAELNTTETADAVWNALPLRATGSTWGDEIYFSIPVELEEAPDARATVEAGDLGYWAPGNAFCIFYGRTPASVGNEIRPASPVNVFGHITGNALVFRSARGRVQVEVQRAE